MKKRNTNTKVKAKVKAKKKALVSFFWLLVLTLTLLTSTFAFAAAHDTAAVMRCLECHTRLPSDPTRAYLFNEEIAAVCNTCHKRSVHSHPVEIVPSMSIPADMPLDGKGRMTCITCHSFHSGDVRTDGEKTFLLRRVKGKLFCYTCHTKL